MRALNSIGAVRKADAFARLAVDLCLEKEVRGHPLRLRGIDAALRVADFKRAHARRAVRIGDGKAHCRCRHRANRDVHSGPCTALTGGILKAHPIDAKLPDALQRIQPHATQIPFDGELDRVFLITARRELEGQLARAIRLRELLRPPENLPDPGTVRPPPKPQNHASAPRLDRR